MTLLLPFILALAVIFTANLVEISSNPRVHRLFPWLMALLNAVLIILGIVLYLLPEDVALFEQDPGTAYLCTH